MPANALVVRTYSEFLVDTGRIYSIKSRLSNQIDPVSFLVVAGSKWCNSIALIASGLKTTVDILEDVEVTDNGTPVILHNQNRNFSDDGLETLVYAGATYSGGTYIRQAQSGFGTNPGQAQAGPVGDTIKMILCPGKKYAFLLTPSAQTDLVIEAVLWEEAV